MDAWHERRELCEKCGVGYMRCVEYAKYADHVEYCALDTLGALHTMSRAREAANRLLASNNHSPSYVAADNSAANCDSATHLAVGIETLLAICLIAPDETGSSCLCAPCKTM